MMKIRLQLMVMLKLTSIILMLVVAMRKISLREDAMRWKRNFSCCLKGDWRKSLKAVLIAADAVHNFIDATFARSAV